MRTPIIITSLCLASAGLLLASGCTATHSQQVRNDAHDRYDRATAQITYDQARQSFQNGQFEEALGHVDRAITRFPKDSGYFLLRGRILNEMKRTEEARVSFAKAIELDPKKAEPHYFMGVVYQRWRQMDDAAREYAKAAQLDPTKLHYVSAEVEVLTAMGKFQEAETRLAAVSKRFEFSPVIDRLQADIAKCRGNDADCVDALERAAVRDEAAPQVLEELAYAKFAMKDWQGVIRTLDEPGLRAVAQRPDLVRLRARCLLLQNRPKEARELLMAIRLQPDPEGRTAILLGNACWALKDWDRVRECGENLVRSNPTLADGYMFLGGADIAQGKLLDGVSQFEQAVARDPEREVPRRMLAESTARLAQMGLPSGATSPKAQQAASAGAMRSDAP